MKALIVSVASFLMVSQLAPAQSQSQKDSWDNLSQLKPGQKIEVVDLKDKSVKGEFITFNEDQISISTGKTGISILRSDVRTVKNRDKDRRGIISRDKSTIFKTRRIAL